jgi:hypothetical protein
MRVCKFVFKSDTVGKNYIITIPTQLGWLAIVPLQEFQAAPFGNSYWSSDSDFIVML